MSGRAKGRPRRGNPLATGGTGIFAGPQGGESGGQPDQASRDYGIPQADIPGGQVHLVNPQAVPSRVRPKPRRGPDYDLAHGVEPTGEQYAPPEDEAAVRAADVPRPAPEPRYEDPVPVYMTERPGRKPVIRRLITEGPMSIASGTTDPVMLAARDPQRVRFWISNEADAGTHTTSNALRIGDYATVADERGLLIPGGTVKDFCTQDEVYVRNDSGAAVDVSWGYETEVEAAL